MATKYHPEPYWSEVGKRIREREDGKNVIAGDDEPYYRYKRNRFLQMLNKVDFSGKKVLEIGCGPGGNLMEVLKKNPARLTGVDISKEMVALAGEKLGDKADIHKVSGTELPFEDQTFDVVFTATVLQHNTDEDMLLKLMGELSRVGKNRVYLFERIDPKIMGDELCLGRTVSYYADIMAKNGYRLESVDNINIRVSYYLCGAIRKLLNPKNRKEGESLNKMSIFLQNASLPFTRVLDKIFKSKRDLAELEFVRERE
ncbi:MAG: class I SAM-dependent methyltransferase [Saprospirales bacterium]|nr:MAG: class I SAM-dependent methyltransferase [Saprospirales bacterium]